MLEAVEWVTDSEFFVNGHRFTCVNHHAEGGMAPPPDDGFNLYKTRGLLETYERVLDQVSPIDNVVELGVFHGGSAALFAELLKPQRLVAFDLERSSASAYLDRYVKENDAVEVHWGVDQGDKRALLDAVGPGPIDLVIDDASHLYDPTVASFEALFPLVRTGGLYLIEDWAWPFWERWAESSFLRFQRSLSDILLDLAGVMVARPGAIAGVDVRTPFIAVERGSAEIHDLSLRNDVYERSNYRADLRWRRVRNVRGQVISQIRRRLPEPLRRATLRRR